jgi:hypothetical protein
MSAPFAYRPLPGSIADRVIRHLQQQPPGMELATAVLAELVGQPPSAICPILKPARDHGVLQARRLPNHGNNLFWSLGSADKVEDEAEEGSAAAPPSPPAAPETAQPDPAPAQSTSPRCRKPGGKKAPAGPQHARQGLIDGPMRGFCCALFSDGRLVLEKPGQSMTLEPDQTRELVRYLERMGGES